jgi:hypothetical protein
MLSSGRLRRTIVASHASYGSTLSHERMGSRLGSCGIFFSFAFSFLSMGTSEMDASLVSQLWGTHKPLENVILHRGNKTTTLVERERGTHFGWQLFYISAPGRHCPLRR